MFVDIKTSEERIQMDTNKVIIYEIFTLNDEVCFIYLLRKILIYGTGSSSNCFLYFTKKKFLKKILLKYRGNVSSL